LTTTSSPGHAGARDFERAMHLMRWYRVAVCTFMTIAAGCGAATGSPDQDPAASESGSMPAIVSVVKVADEARDWGQDSFDDWKKVGTGEISPQMITRLPFAPAVPASVGPPAAVYVYAPAAPGTGEVAVFLRYDENSPVGPFWLWEERREDPFTSAEIIAMSNSCTECTSSGAVSISEQIEGGLMAGSPATTIYWFEDGINFKVTGPDDTFTPDDALAVARETATALPLGASAGR